MSKTPKNHGKHWSDDDIKQLRELATGNTPTRVIGLKLGRTLDAVENKASEEDITLKPGRIERRQRRKLGRSERRLRPTWWLDGEEAQAVHGA